jgi:hypothetical protein
LLPKDLSLSYQKYGFGIRDPEKNLFRIPGHMSTGSQFRIRNTVLDHRGITQIPTVEPLVPYQDSLVDGELAREEADSVAVLPHLLRQPGGGLPRVAEDHRLNNNSSHVKTVHLHNGTRAKRYLH